MDKPQIIIGLGTGRCGTVSLSHLLNSQKSSQFTHEANPRLPWEQNMNLFDKFMTGLEETDKDFVGDVSFYHLPYVEQMIMRNSEIKFVCLQRDKDATVKSYLKKIGERNHWSSKGTVDVWDKHYPTYEEMAKPMAIGKYWDDYYAKVNGLAWQYPDSVKIWKTEDLNNEESVLEILEFCGFDLSLIHI